MSSKSLWTRTEIASENRYKVSKIIVLLLALLLFGRLVQLQVINYQFYSARANSQTIKQLSITPVRGLMYDRTGKIIVHNVPSFSVTLTPFEFRKEVMPLLASILPIDSNEIYALIKRFEKYSPHTAIKILREADQSVIASIEEFSDRLIGIDLVVDSRRVYDFSCNMAHTIGYIREVTADQLKEFPYYKQGDMIGRTGLEQIYERFLRGRDGSHFVLVDNMGQKIDSFANKEYDIRAQNGSDLNLSIDIEMQELAEKLLSGKRGAIVAIDPNNGEVIICVSKPDYDPRLFSGKVPADIYNELYNDKANPLLPRALQSQYPPGSTWKMLIALAALQEGIINDKSTIFCNGGYTLGGRTWKCHGTGCGAVNVRNALRTSCNTFFCELGVRLGIDRFEKYGAMFNFGVRTQIDLPFEARGILPTRKYYNKNFPDLKRFAGRMANLGIGQGELLTTPLQMAAYTATIASGGTYYQPHIVKSIRNTSTEKIDNLHWDSKNLPINPYYFDVVKDGMWAVVNAGGTGGGVAISGLNVCGKTGTAQNTAGADHSWFVCFAPKNNPKIAMCVFVENAGYGSAVAAPIARRLLQKFFGKEPEMVAPVITEEFIDTEELVYE